MAAAPTPQSATELGGPDRFPAHPMQPDSDWLGVTLYSIGDAVIATDTRQNVTFLNPVAESLTGWTAADAVGTPLEDVFHIVNEYTREPVESPVARVLREGAIVGLANHTLLIARDGTGRSIDDSAAPIKTANGEITGVVLVFRDVTVQRTAERRRAARLAVTQILAEETSVESALAAILDAICSALDWDVGCFWQLLPDGTELHCREFWHQTSFDVPEFRAATMQLTFSRGESFPGRVWESGAPIWIRDVAVEPGFRRAAEAGQSELHGGFACPVIAGREFLGVLECFSGEIRQPDDDLLEMMATIGAQIGQFIDRRTTEQRLLRSERDLSDFFDNANVGLHWVGPDGTILRVNQTELDLLGYSREEYVGRHIAEFHADRPVIEDILQRLACGEELDRYPARLRAKDGSIRDVLINSSVLFEDGAFVHTRCFTVDVTEQVRAEELRARLAAIVESSDDVIVSKSLDGIIQSWNRGAERVFGYTAAEAVGESINLVIPPELRDEELGILKRLRQGETIDHYETVRVAKDGRRVDVSLTISPIRDAQGRIVAASKVARDITEQKRASATLRDSEERFSRFMENLPGLAWIKDLDGRYVYANEAAELAFQADGDRLYGKTDEEIFPPDVAAQFREHDRRALESGSGVQVVEALTHHDETVHHSVVSKFPIPGPDGEPMFVGGAAIDITELKQAEEAVRESEGRFRTLANAVPALVWAAHANGSVFYLNPRWEEYAGKPIEKALGSGWSEILHPDDREQVLAAWQQAVLTGKVFAGECRYRRHDGAYRLHYFRALPLPSDDGKPAAWYGVSLDIEDRVAAEQALRESDERFRELANNIDQFAWTCDELGDSNWYNQRWYDYTGTTFEEMQGMGWRKVQHPDHVDRVVRRIEEAAAANEPWEDVFPLRGKDGNYRWFLSRAMPIRDAAGNVVRWLGTNTDITNEREAEQSLQFLAEASKSLASLVDYKSTLQQVARLAVPQFADWCVVDMLNDAGELERLAVAHRDPEKSQWAQLLAEHYPRNPDAQRGAVNVLRTGKPELMNGIDDAMLVAAAQDDEHLGILREMQPRAYICVPLRKKGKSCGALTFIAAESGRSYTPEDLALAEDLAHRASIAIENALLFQEVREADRRKDEFLAMLAHELRNPMAPIRSGLDILAMEEGINRETIALMQEQVQHLVRLVDDLLDVSRIMRGRIDLRREPIDLAAIIERSAEVIRPQMEANRHEFSVAMPTEPLWLNADPVRMVQILENLLNNAAKYTNDGGRIELTATREKGAAVVCVKDTGMGIEPELLPKVFDLFTQSSRSLARAEGGLGIGLTLVRRLVEMHGGTVSAHSDGPGAGSTFVVRLPLAGAARQKPGVDRPERTADPRRILVVDDNAGAARMLAMLLSKLGDHEVETACDGASALDKIRDMHPEIVLLDIGLPGMDGYEVARNVRQSPRFDNVFLAALTGYGQEEDRRRSREAGFDLHLVKPVEIAVLEQLLADFRPSGN